MTPQQVEYITYFIGILVLGMSYYVFTRVVPGPVFLVGVLGYLVALRVLGRHLAKRWASKGADAGSDV